MASKYAVAWLASALLSEQRHTAAGPKHVNVTITR
jgi:hypothetical protein